VEADSLSLRRPKKLLNGGRYETVNILGRGFNTIEYRLWPATSQAWKILGYAGISAQLTERGRELGKKDLRELSRYPASRIARALFTQETYRFLVDRRKYFQKENG
jgi:hypothetical protein